MRFTTLFLAAFASAVLAQQHDMANMANMAPAAGAPGAPAAPVATPPPAAAKPDSKKGSEGGKPVATQIFQINDGQVQAPTQTPPKAPEGTTTITNKTTHTKTNTATPSKPAQQTKNAGNALNVGSGLGLLGLAAAIIA